MKPLPGWLVAFTFALAMSGCDDSGDAAGNSAARWLDLEIERPEAEIVEPKFPIVEEVDGDELITNAYIVPPSFLHSAPGGGVTGSAAPDPFSVRDLENRGKKLSAKGVLEAFGVVFQPGTWATYEYRSSTLIVCQTRDQLDLVEAVTQSIGVGRGAWSAINIRVEIYEVSSGDSRQLEKSASEHFENTPELDAVINLVRNGKASIVTTIGMKARSGQRAGYESGIDFRYVAEFNWLGEGENRVVKPVFKSRLVGTLLEVDPVCGPTDVLDVRVSLEHHTSPPRMESRMMKFPGSESGEQPAEFPVFTFHKIDTYETMMSGTVKLLGSWDAGPGAGDSRQIAFLRTDLQPLMGTDWSAGMVTLKRQ